MINHKTVAVVVPCYNEETQIGIVLDTMPDFVDRIIVVNDKSVDQTSDIVRSYIKNNDKDYSNPKIGVKKITPDFFNEAEVFLEKKNEEEIQYFPPSTIENKSPEKDRIILINHLKNSGVGASIARGYKWAKDNQIDCTAVMAGDGQMDPSELLDICTPVINEGVDYVKGNRLHHKSARFVMPKTRFIGNSVLSILTKIASGFWRISDTQTGYTAISLEALNKIDLHRIYKKYGMPNDMLVKLNIANCSVKEVVIKPVYRVGEQSKMKVHKIISRIPWLLLRLFIKRIWVKYVMRDFHPLSVLYFVALILFLIDIPYLIQIFKNIITPGVATPNSILLTSIFLTISSIQFLLFAMWMDIQDNERLYK